MDADKQLAILRIRTEGALDRLRLGRKSCERCVEVLTDDTWFQRYEPVGKFSFEFDSFCIAREKVAAFRAKERWPSDHPGVFELQAFDQALRTLEKHVLWRLEQRGLRQQDGDLADMIELLFDRGLASR